jgi:hypothetical protein
LYRLPFAVATVLLAIRLWQAATSPGQPGPHPAAARRASGGVITSYRAVVDPAAVGMGFEALVRITLERGDAGTVASSEADVVELAQVWHAERLFGDPDYLLRIVARDLDNYATPRDRRLATRQAYAASLQPL